MITLDWTEALLPPEP